MNSITNPGVANQGLLNRIGSAIGLIQDETKAPRVPWLTAFIGTALAMLVFGVYRWYQQNYSFTVGMDYFEEDFQKYWMNLFWVQITLISLGGAIGIPLVWFTRPAKPELMSPATELKIYYLILSFAGVASVLVMAGLGVFVEADAAWHQTTIRDTDFTPTHIALFYFVIPAGLVGSIIGFIWVHTRLPNFVNRISVPMAILTAGPILIMPNLGFNEWGHTFFYMEELFSAPIHWGFVTLGWAIFAIGGFVIQVLNRILELTALDTKQKTLV